MKIINLNRMKRIMNNVVFFSINATAVFLLLFYMTFIINNKDKVINNKDKAITKLELTKDSLDVVKDSLDIEIKRLNYTITKLKLDSVHKESIIEHF